MWPLAQLFITELGCLDIICEEDNQMGQLQMYILFWE